VNRLRRVENLKAMSKLGGLIVPGQVSRIPVYWRGGIRHEGGVNLIPGSSMQRGNLSLPMLREKSKWRTREDESTDAEHRGGPTRSSVEVPVMGMERRGRVIWSYSLANQ